MNILHVIQAYEPFIGGGVKNFKCISEELVRRGHTVSIYTSTALDTKGFTSLRHGKRLKNAPHVREENGIKVFRFRPLILPLLQWKIDQIYYGPTIPGMFLEYRKNKDAFDLVHSTTMPFTHNYHAFRLARSSNIPYVCTPAVKVLDLKHYRSKAVETLRRASAIIVRVRFEKKILVNKYRVKPERIHYVGVGINPQNFENVDGSSFRRAYGLRDEKLILFVGRLALPKGFHYLIKAFIKEFGGKRAYKLVLIGPMSIPAKMIKDSIPSALKEQIIFTGPIYDRRFLADAYSAADIFVNPSADDNFGVVFIEAWASGTPVIGARFGGVMDLIKEGIDGLFVEFGNVEDLRKKMSFLIENKDIRQRLGNMGRRRALKDYTWTIIVDKIERIYRECIS
ncbi:MAG: glycosyltransferase family 4 protein [Candidatus Hodarchaeota archaeon]